MDYSALFIKIIIFVILLAIGYIGSGKGILTKEFSKSASWLLVNVFVVASIVNSMLCGRPEMTSSEMWKAMGILWLLMFLIYAIAEIYAHFFRKDEAPQILILMAVVNNLFVGLPVVQALCGSEPVFYIGMSSVPYNLIAYSYGIWRLKKGGRQGVKLRDLITPPLLASVVTLVIFAFDVPIPRFATDFFGTLAGATVPLSMVVIGATLGNTKIADAFRDTSLWVLSLVRLVAAPVIVWLVLSRLTDNTALLLAATVIAGCPSGISCTPLSVQYGYDAAFSSRAIMVTTLLSMMTLPALLYVLF